MVYTDTMLPVFQRNNMHYFFLSSTKSYEAVHKLPVIDKAYKPIGPTILVEWEE